jgi:hypothetical protein
MRLRLALTSLLGMLALVSPGLARAAGGSYVFAGGNAREQAQVRAALDASSFDWGLVPETVTIHIAAGHASEATPGSIWLDADLVDSGRFAWGTIQHEYAHQVDFFLLDDAARQQLQAALGGSSWWATAPGQAHGDLASERFASTLAWSFWESKDNTMRPSSAGDESGSVAPARFRALLAGLLGAPQLTAAPLVARRA